VCACRVAFGGVSQSPGEPVPRSGRRLPATPFRARRPVSPLPLGTGERKKKKIGKTETDTAGRFAPFTNVYTLITMWVPFRRYNSITPQPPSIASFRRTATRLLLLLLRRRCGHLDTYGARATPVHNMQIMLIRVSLSWTAAAVLRATEAEESSYTTILSYIVVRRQNTLQS